MTDDDIWHRANAFVNVSRGFVIYEPLNLCRYPNIRYLAKTHDVLFLQAVSCRHADELRSILRTYLADKSNLKQLRSLQDYDVILLNLIATRYYPCNRQAIKNKYFRHLIRKYSAIISY